MDRGQAEQLLDAIEGYVDAKVYRAVTDSHADPNDTWVGGTGEVDQARAVLLSQLQAIG